ncbi:threonine/serine dehydratase [Nonomuraea deserti]|uniref:threonine ammonia-lyase n=1 Tax=Nonomuraea deserti TaxID=1848322 RepID=A0A4R4VJQ2_9ACTN|nr:threonine/serine dehydratase [Nonomuraea deserti]TDD05959.1 threonine/serine dehydratase [Nonomuraea deserti]
MTGPVTLADIRAAAERISDTAVRTPLVPFAPADPGRPLWIKPESLQPTAAFKLRGAYNKIKQLLPEARERGVVAHSSGNHARSVAWLAQRLRLRAVIVMPDTAPANKVDAVRALGAEVVLVPPSERDTHGFVLAEKYGYLPVPPFDDPAVVAGQGTVGLEIMEDLPDADVVLVPVSGGGLAAGVATAVKALRPTTLVIGVEPDLASDAAQSLREGRRVAWEPERTYRTVADGLRTTGLGVVPWEQIRRHLDEIVTVGEEQILDAVRRLALDARLVAEPSGAVTFAAYLAGETTGKHVAILSGGSVNPELLARVLTRPDLQEAPHDR